MRCLRAVAPVLLVVAVQLIFAQESAQTGAQSSSQQAKPQQIPARVYGNIEVLTDTQGVDFGPYLGRVLKAVKQNWYAIIPESARPPQLKRGAPVIEFMILSSGKVAGLRYAASSGDISLDRAAWGAITASDPFLPLPQQFHGPYLALRVHFYYNPNKTDLPAQQPQPATKPAGH